MINLPKLDKVSTVDNRPFTAAVDGCRKNHAAVVNKFSQSYQLRMSNIYMFGLGSLGNQEYTTN